MFYFDLNDTNLYLSTSLTFLVIVILLMHYIMVHVAC